MRSTPILALASLLLSAALAACGPVRTERQKSAALAVAGGAGIATLGGLLVIAEEESDCSRSGGAFCPDLSGLYDPLGVLMIITGGAFAAVGLGRLAADPAPPAPASRPPCSRTPARGACETRPPSDRRRTP